jgi:GGDEF domain-containing protein
MPPVHLRGVLSASIGIAVHVPDRESTRSFDLERNDLLRRADAAMYHAKALGKNQAVVWNASMLGDPRSALSEPAAT